MSQLRTRRPRPGRGQGRGGSLGGTRGSSMVRLRLGFIVIAMVVSLFGARLVQLQGLDPEGYAAAASSAGLKDVILPATRGVITDRTGAPLATSVQGLMITADPTQTGPQAPAIAKLLANRLGVDYVDTKTALTPNPKHPKRQFAYVDRRVPSTVATAVVDEARKLGYQGLYTFPDPVRVYPAHDVAANVIGFLGDNGAGASYGAGMELTFNQLLAGTDGSEKYEIGGGNRLPLGEDVTVPPVNGTNVQLTIDRDTQWYLQRVLAQAVRESRADSGMAVVQDVHTGELLGLADYPSYDADAPGDSPKRLYKSAALTSPYEPGSVEKVLTMSSLLDQHLVTPRTRLTVPDAIRVEDATIHDYFQHAVLPFTLTGVLARSSNVGTLLAARRIASPVLRHYLTEFGLGQPTAIGVAGESSGVLPAAPWSDLSKSTIAFGQGLSVNAVQMTAAINTIANGGVYVSPSIVEGSATTSSGQQVGTDQTTTRRVVSTHTAHQVRNMMEQVLSPNGIAQNASIPGYRVAGKTGTAQVVKNGKYQNGVFNVSFAGFAPADDPRFTVYVVVRHPRNHGGGGSVGGPVFQKVMSHLLRSYGIAPSGSTPSSIPICWATCPY